MKKCCVNCSYYHGCLGEEESFYHIHSYCAAWDRTNACPMYSLINNFLDDYCIEFDHLCDDNETGESYCYRFDQIEEQNKVINDEWLKNNFEHNKKLALGLIDKIILEAQCYNKILDREEKLEQEELTYFRALRKEIIATNWEDDSGKVYIK